VSPDRHRGLEAYSAATASYAVGLRPQDALAISLWDVLGILTERYGDAVAIALSPEAVDLDAPLTELPEAVRSPRASEPDSSWMRATNMVGVNVRTVGGYGGVIKYALTLPAVFDSIQLLPIWEPGVVESLYGIAGWNLNYEFFSDELYEYAPNLDSIERQLRATTNLLHLMGKTVGMDVIPHTDRFSEPALGNPDLFEWMKIRDRTIVDHSDALIGEVRQEIFGWFSQVGPAAGTELPPDPDTLFGLDEADRLLALFGEPKDLFGRIERRVELVKHLKWFGLEPVPATMGVPFRGIEIDPDPAHSVVDDYGMEWPDFVISKPEFMSRVFSPLARYKLYERIDDNANWEIDFARPRAHVWDYVCDHYAHAQHIGNFDFMRGEHVPRPDATPWRARRRRRALRHPRRGQDPHPGERTRAVVRVLRRDVPPGAGRLPVREELDHLEASLADSTLGDLQSTVVGDHEFLRRFRRYLDDLATRTTAPAFTVMTADKDDPRFDEFYRAGNEVRMFTALLLPDMPSYTGLGFEIRDVHWEPVANERYTKLFVFHEEGDSNIYPSKARFGDEFIWGENDALFDRLTSLREFAESVAGEIAGTTTRWLIPPDATTLRGIAAWTQADDPRYAFVVNYDLEQDSGYFGVPGLAGDLTLTPVYTTLGSNQLNDTVVVHNGFFHRIENLAPGEGRAYSVVNSR